MLFLLVAVAFSLFPLSLQNEANITEIYLALDNVFNYIYDNYKLFKIDGLFGVVVAEGHLESLLHEKALSRLDRMKIYGLIKKSKVIVRIIKNNLKYPRRNYNKLLDKFMLPKLWYNRMARRLPKLIDHNKPKNITSLRSFLNYLKSSNLSETLSDRCIYELLRYDGNSPHFCKISYDCKQVMVDGDYYDPAYGVTHRLLYLQIAKTQKCIFNQSWYRRKTIAYCAYINWEMRQNAFFGFIDELDDILLEQIALCGYEGFFEFFASDLIEHVLDIQNENGCFQAPSGTAKRREKRTANFFSDGCNDHTTGLGAVTLALYLKYAML